MPVFVASVNCVDAMDPLYDVFYEKYLLLYSLHGGDREQLDRETYEKFDRELLTLVERSQERDLTIAEVSRLKELEYLLLDDVAEGFWS